jgi:hypothetical protein
MKKIRSAANAILKNIEAKYKRRAESVGILAAIAKLFS